MTDSMRLPKQVGNMYRTIKSSVLLGNVSQSSISANFGAFAFTLSGNCLDYTALTSAYDQYKIGHVEVIFKPRFSQTTNNISGAPFNGGFLYTVIDYDDQSVLTNTTSALDYENCIVSSLHEDCRRCFKPRIAIPAYQSVGVGYTNMADQWIDAASPGIQHYGLKWAVDQSPTSSFQTWDVFIRVEFLFRASR